MVRTVSAAVATIKPEKNEFDDNFLDVVGNEFRFDHAKGIAEWLKNSADAYATTTRAKDAEQFILLRFKQAKPKRDSRFECIDFVGMTRLEIDRAVKVWGLKTAAKKGTTKATYGGHGNGGKFYMRQMFGSSRFITYREGKLNVFGFDEKKRYGYATKLKDRPMSLDEALKYAELDVINVPSAVLRRWKRGTKVAGFTVVRGMQPERFSGRATVASILEKLKLHPQARRLLAHKSVVVVLHGQAWGDRLLSPSVVARDGFERARVIPLPRSFDHKGEEFQFRRRNHLNGRLTLRTSAQPFSRSSDLAALNAIDMLGEVGCIGSYQMFELGFLRNAAESEFIYGECECSFLEDEALNSVKNDREKLVDNELTQALIEWIRQQVDELAGELAEKSQTEKKTRDLRQSSMFNQLLDRWKNRFMEKLTAEIFGGPGLGDMFGGVGGGSSEKSKTGKSSKKNSKNGDMGDDGEGGGSGDDARKGPKFPKVLLSGFHKDPLDEAATGPFYVDERQPPIYQRDVDIAHGIYWINTARPLANKIMDAYGSESPRWREYLFQRYVEIILKQSIYELNRRDPDFSAAKVDGLIDDITSRVHDAAADDLEQFLFSDNLTGSVSTGAEDAGATTIGGAGGE